jgi:very-short-patch-repair endonuclease
MRSLTTTAARLATSGRSGATRFGTVVEARQAWQRPAESGLEVRFIQALRSAGLPDPVRQLPLQLPDGRRICVDLAYPTYQLAIEIDGYGHTGPTAHLRDQSRDELMMQIGWVTLRYSKADLWPDCGSAITQVIEVLDFLGAATGATTARTPKNRR